MFIFYWLLHGNGRGQLKESSFRAYVCQRRPGGSRAISDLVTTARLSDLSMRSFNAVESKVRRSPEQSARQPIARSSKFVLRAYSPRALDCEKTMVLCFLPSWSTLLFERGLGEEGRPDVAASSETPKPSCQSYKQQLLRTRSGLNKAARTRTTRVKEQQVLSKQ